MKRHIESQHPVKWKEINANEELPSVKNFFSPKPEVKKYKLTSLKRKTLNRKVVRYIIKDMRPLNSVTGEGFKDLLKELDGCYVLPSVKFIRKKLLPKIFAETQNGLREELKFVKALSMTCDGWTSAAADKYNAYTIHYIDWSSPNPELKTKLLGCVPFDPISGTGEELVKDIRKICDNYDVTSKIVATTADNASDIQLALKLFGKPRLGCLAHKFNLCAKDAMKGNVKIDDLIKKLAKIVRRTKVSPGAKKVLIECLQRVGIQGNYLLINLNNKDH